MSHNPTTKNTIQRNLLGLFKYLGIFVLIYTAVNFWRAPSAPDVHAPTLGLPQSTLTASQQEPVLVYFWATWCGVCGVTSPAVNALHQANYPVVAISVNSGDNDEVRAFLNTKHYQFTNINDENRQIFNAWQGQVTPSFAILHQEKVEQTFTGFAPLWLLKARLWWAKLF